MVTAERLGATPIRQSLARPVLVGGCERIPVYVLWTAVAILTLQSGLYVPALLTATVLATVGTWALRQAAKWDPQATKVCWRGWRQPRYLPPSAPIWTRPAVVRPGGLGR